MRAHKNRVAGRFLSASVGTRADDLMSENETLPEELDRQNFDEIAEILSPLGQELGRGDFSLVLNLGNRVLKVMTDEVEFKLLHQVQASKMPSLPWVFSLHQSRFFNLGYAEIKKYHDLPSRWRTALRNLIHHEETDDPEGDSPEIASEYGVGVKEAQSFFEAMNWLARQNVVLQDMKMDNFMWDKENKVPVWTDLGEQ